jgi:DNA-binding beta-propeller fold protein YncE
LSKRLVAASVLLVVIIVAGQQLRESVHVRKILSWPVSVLDGIRYSPKALGDGGPATRIRLFDPMGVALGPAGELFISDRGRDKAGRIIWRIDPDGSAHVVAGSGRRGQPRAGGLARDSDLSRPEGLAFGPDGLLYFVDARAGSILRIEEDGTLRVIAGSGGWGYAGDGGPANRALLNNPADIRFDEAGNLYIADVYNHRVRRVSPTGIIETVAGTGVPGSSGDGGLAAEAQLDHPWGIFIHPSTGSLLIADSGNHRVREVDQTGRINTRIGSGAAGYSGDGGDARLAQLDSPQSLGFDCAGRMYIGDEHNNAIRVVELDGTIRTLVGNGAPGFAGEGVAGTGAGLNDPENMAVLCDGTIYVTDGDNGRVIKVASDGTVLNFAGRGP